MICHVDERNKIELPPFNNTIHADGLDLVFSSRHNGENRDTGLTIPFCYARCEVIVSSEGTLTLIELTDEK
ncbi:HalOD1 output domain-containing protein [Halobaculum rubrum]|uniref:HalOD1 output domain-containing protein n=1 Tax=Halobaculum rubrum TaxID=2872158 RepID=UPI001CA448F7|nr:hypothetical protein K6T25_13455 [Halobaculum rubrum]